MRGMHTASSFLSSDILFLPMYFPKNLLSLNLNISACLRRFEAQRLPSAVVSELTSVFEIHEVFLQASSTLSNFLQLKWKLLLLEFQKYNILFLLLKKISSNSFSKQKSIMCSNQKVFCLKIQRNFETQLCFSLPCRREKLPCAL